MTQKDFVLSIVKTHKKIIKPWKRRLYAVENYSGKKTYEDGWNDCLKAMEKSHKAFMKNLTELVEKT